MTSRPASTNLPFSQALRELLAERATLPPEGSTRDTASGERATLNALAVRIGIAQSHLWRVVNRPNERRASLELIASVARALELPDDYFLETRAGVVDHYLRANPRRLNEVYLEARRAASPSGGSDAADAR